jgi:hypothetical protein
MNIKKKKVFKDYRGYIITFRYYGFHYASLADAEKVRKYRHAAGVIKGPEEEEITMFYWLIGVPDKIVNADKTISEEMIRFYNYDEIEWYPEFTKEELD